MAKQRLEIEISGNDSKFGAAADRTMLRLNKLGSAVSKMAGVFGIGLGASAVIGAAKGVASYASELQALSRRIGVGVEVFQKLEYAAKGYGGSLNDVASVLQRIAEIRIDAVRGGPNSEMAVMLDRLGVKFEDLQTMRVDQLFYKIAEAIRTAKTDQALLGEATKALGSAVNSLIPAMRQGIAGLGEEFEKLGGIIDEQTTKKISDAEGRLQRWWMRAKGMTAKEVVDTADIPADAWRNLKIMTSSVGQFFSDAFGLGPGKGMFEKRAMSIPDAWRAMRARWSGIGYADRMAGGHVFDTRSPEWSTYYGPANYDWQGPPAPDGYGAPDIIADAVKKQILPMPSRSADALARIGLFRGGSGDGVVQRQQLAEQRRANTYLASIASSLNVE